MRNAAKAFIINHINHHNSKKKASTGAFLVSSGAISRDAFFRWPKQRDTIKRTATFFVTIQRIICRKSSR